MPLTAKMSRKLFLLLCIDVMSCPLLPSDILNNKNPGTSFVVDIKKLEQMLQIYMANVHKSSDKTLNGQVQVAVVYFSTRVDCVITVNGMKVQGSEKNERKKMEWMNVVSGGNVVTQSVECLFYNFIIYYFPRRITK